MRTLASAVAVTVLAAGLGAAGCQRDAQPAAHAGNLVACPPDVPSGPCSPANMVCQYPTQSCVCTDTGWTCLACPATQPEQKSSCSLALPPPGPAVIVSLRCAYGDVTCSCQDEIGPSVWRCGACPAAAPATDQPCGNTVFTCVYGDQECDCLGGPWRCTPMTCPAPGAGDATLCPGTFTCEYPDQDQVCTCSSEGGGATRLCSCPASAPSTSAACAESAGNCVYSDRRCDCINGQWMCVQGCPGAKPSAGSSCTTALSCTYADGLCYCASGTWHC